MTKVFYQNSEVSYSWKFPLVWYYDKDSYDCPQPNTTPRHCSGPGGFNSDLQLPQLNQTHSLPNYYFRYDILGHQMTQSFWVILEPSTATWTIYSCFTAPSLKISPPPPACPIQLQRCPCQAREPLVCPVQGCSMKRQTFSYHPGFYLIWCFNSSLSPETFCNTAESPWATPGCVSNTRQKQTPSRNSWDAGGKKTGFHLCMKII